MSNVHLDTAFLCLQCGLSPVPPTQDGSKAPFADLKIGGKASWAAYQSTPATKEHVRSWYKAKRTGNGLATGYGNLECLEFDDWDTYKAYTDAALALGLMDLVERVEGGYCERTPGKGVHWLYRCEEVKGNTKLAERPVPGEKDKRDVLIETRGKGGFVIIAPTTGTVHPTGGAYELMRGGLPSIATITPDERDALWDLARTFDEMPTGVAPLPRAKGTPAIDARPGEAYAAGTTWHDILEPLGWVAVFTRGDVTYWRRPGKDRGISATTGHCKGFYCFSTSTSFEPRRSYTKFGALTHFCYGGDFAAAAKDLAKQGYGKPGQPVHQGGNGKPVDAAKPLILWASDSVPRDVEWLWPDMIPIGKLTTFAGWGGLGKSFVTMDLASRISRGAEIPGSKQKFMKAKVLILNTEDDPDDTSVPRLIAAGADLTQIAFARSEVLSQFTLNDIAKLDAMLLQMGGVRLVIIDPATAHLGDANDHRNAELKALLMPLSLWAMKAGVAIVLVTHVNKPQAGKVEAMARVVGGVAWVNSVRSAVMFVKKPEDKKQRLFIPFKSNCAPEPKGLAYAVRKVEPLAAYPKLTRLARIEWMGEVDITADDAMNHIEKKSVGRETVEWLTERFREKGEWESNELRDLARQAGVSTDALFKGEEVKALPIKKRPRTDANGNKCWTWLAIYPWPPIQASESTETSENPNATPY